LDGHIINRIDIRCPDEKESAEARKNRRYGHAVELWQADRFIEALRPGYLVSATVLHQHSACAFVPLTFQRQVLEVPHETLF
jgi:hypothetical protein